MRRLVSLPALYAYARSPECTLLSRAQRVGEECNARASWKGFPFSLDVTLGNPFPERRERGTLASLNHLACVANRSPISPRPAAPPHATTERQVRRRSPVVHEKRRTVARTGCCGKKTGDSVGRSRQEAKLHHADASVGLKHENCRTLAHPRLPTAIAGKPETSRRAWQTTTEHHLDVWAH